MLESQCKGLKSTISYHEWPQILWQTRRRNKRYNGKRRGNEEREKPL